MSYILDALKKIEYEKNRRSRQGDRNGIAAGLFLEDSRPSSSVAIWKFLLIAVLVSLVTLAAVWFLLQRGGKRDAALSTRPQVAESPQITQLQPSQVQQSASVAATPVKVNAERADDEEDSPGGGDRRRYERTRRVPRPQVPATQSAQVPADIKLSGIAFQDERRARRAVINGYLLSEGAVVSGARIIGIYADKVRFSSSAGQFEIKLDAALPLEVRQ